MHTHTRMYMQVIAVEQRRADEAAVNCKSTCILAHARTCRSLPWSNGVLTRLLLSVRRLQSYRRYGHGWQKSRYVCMLARTYVCMCVCLRVRMCVCVCEFACTCACVCVCLRVLVCACVCMCVCMYGSVNVRVRLWVCAPES